MSSSKNITLWEQEFLPQYKDIFDNTKDSWISHEDINIYTDYQNKYEKEKLNYKQQHNSFLYFFYLIIVLPISFITIIPAYWAFKKYKELKANKERLIKAIDDTKNKKLDVHAQILKNINFLEIVKSFSEIIKYEHKGPIPSKLVEEMQYLSLFDLSNYDSNSNSYNSSWGVIDNKIVIHASKQQHQKFNKTYKGSQSVSYFTVDSQGKSVARSTIVTASYTHPAFDIFSERFTFSFMESCSNLEFKYKGTKSLFSRHKNEYSPLENSEFEKRYKWFRNDDIQFRMIFTPYTQEMFLLELEDKKEVPPELQWGKTSSFFHNNFDTIQLDYIIYKNIGSISQIFLLDPDKNINDLISNIYDSIISYYYGLYKNMNYLFLTTIMPSENHLTIINAVEQSKKKISNQNNYFFAHNILSEFIGKEIIHKDTNCFNNLIETNTQKIGNCDIYISTMEGLTYKIVKKVTYVPTYSPIANKTVNVPVEYDDYIPMNANAKVAYGYINSDKYYFNIPEIGIKTNITNDNLLSLINDLPANTELVLKDGIIAFLFLNDIDQESICKIVESINNQ